MNLDAPNSKGKTIRDYLPLAAQRIMGKAQPEGVATEAIAEGNTAIGKKAIEKAAETLKKYKDGKKKFEDRIVEEERWWKLRHWEVINNGKSDTNRPEPTSAWMFNSIAAKHADIMDNYPEPNVLPREQGDEQSAKILSSILPVVYERNNYEETFSDAAWYKLKHGVVAKGVFWNTELEEGLGDIDTQFIDMLNKHLYIFKLCFLNDIINCNSYRNFLYKKLF